jgi:hypothetical protein
MARVYLAEDLKNERPVAIKVLRPEVAAALGSERFIREIKTTARLTHPHILPLHDSGEAGGFLYYVMPYVEGESLRDRLNREKQLAVEDAVDIACDVAGALSYAHGRDVVHRDIKPENILLMAGSALVADFGIARAVTVAGGSHLTESGFAVGTPAYMSPEQASGEPDVGARSDLYALGCVLYEMLAGQPPFTGPTAQAITARKLSESAPDVAVVRDSVPPAVAGTLGKALARVPADRYATAARFAEALRRSDKAWVTPSAARAGPVVSRRALLGSAAAAGLLGFAGGVLWPTARRRAPSFQRLTFQRGLIRTARFAPNPQTIYYGALWGGDVCRVYRVLLENPLSDPEDDWPPATPLAISSRGEVALCLGNHFRGVLQSGTLALAPLSGGAPRERLEDVSFADWSPDGTELAVVRRVEGRERLEFPVGNVVAEPSAELGQGFTFPRVSREGDRVAFLALTASPLTGRVATVDRQGNTTILSPESPNLFGLAWNGDEIWYTVSEERPLFRNAIHAISPDGSTRVVARIPGNASLHDISPDGAVLIARTNDRGGMAFRASGQDRERDLSLLDHSDIADISRDGSTILFTESGVGGGPAGSVYVRATGGGPAVRIGSGRGLALSPDGRWALAAAVTPGVANDHLTLLPLGAGEERRVERPGFTYYDRLGSWLPDGQRLLVYARQGSGGYRHYVQEIDGDAIHPVTPESVSADSELSPDGALLAVASRGGVDLYPVDGGEPRSVPSRIEGSLVSWIDAGLLVSPPSGTRSNPATDNVVSIDVIDPTSGIRERWQDLQPQDPVGLMVLPTWFAATPDGSAYAYSWHRALSDLYLVDGLT